VANADNIQYLQIMNAVEYLTYSCAYCGAENETPVDLSAGARQSYVEDCAVCCRPNVLSVVVDPETTEMHIEAEPED
jgi:Cysteine-rich CPXCG